MRNRKLKAILPAICGYSLLYAQTSVAPVGEVKIEHINENTYYNDLGTYYYQKDAKSVHDTTIGGDFGAQVSYENLIFETMIGGSYCSADENKQKSSYYDLDEDNFIYLSSLNLTYKTDHYNVKGGRFLYSTQLVNANKLINSNAYQGLLLNANFKDLDVDLLYFNKIASSTQAKSVPLNHIYGILGYGMGYKIGEFEDISTHIVGEEKDSNTAVLLKLKYGQSQKITLENLYVKDFFNMISLELASKHQFEKSELEIKANHVFQKDIGANYLGESYGKKIDSKFYQFQTQFSHNNKFVRVQYAITPANEDSAFDGAIASPFSNRIGWIKGPLTQHSFISDTKSKAIVFGGKFEIGKLPFYTQFGFLKYDVGEKNSLGVALSVYERYLHLSTFFSKELSLSFEVADSYEKDPLKDQEKFLKSYITYKF